MPPVNEPTTDENKMMDDTSGPDSGLRRIAWCQKVLLYSFGCFFGLNLLRFFLGFIYQLVPRKFEALFTGRFEAYFTVSQIIIFNVITIVTITSALVLSKLVSKTILYAIPYGLSALWIMASVTLWVCICKLADLLFQIYLPVEFAAGVFGLNPQPEQFLIFLLYAFTPFLILLSSLILINLKATRLLKSGGYKVGIFGTKGYEQTHEVLERQDFR